MSSNYPQQEGGGNSTMMMMVLLGIVVCSCIVCCCSSVVASANESNGPDALKFDWYWKMKIIIMNSLGLSDGLLGGSPAGYDDDGGDDGGDGGGDGTAPSGDTPSGTKDCVKYTRKKCDGKTGKSRDWCFSKYKKSCVEAGGEWKSATKDDWKGKDCVKYAKDKCDGKKGKSRSSCIGKYKSTCVERGGTWKSSSGSSPSGGSSPSAFSELKVKLVDDPHKGTGSATYDVGAGDYPDLRLDLDKKWNDRIAAFDIPPGLRVIAYTNPNFGGTKITLDGKSSKDQKGYYTHWVDRVNGEQMWDKISSMKVQDMRGSQIKDAANNIKIMTAYLAAKKKSKCNIGKEDGYKFRVRRKTSSGRWECPKGWKETQCGKVRYDAGNGNMQWVDGSKSGAMQCKKKA